MRCHFSVTTQFREDGLGKLLAQLHAPLIERVNIPDDALRVNFVLVHGDEAPKRPWGQLVHKDGVGGAVAEEHLVRNNVLARALLPHLRLSLAAHERLRLRKEVAEEDRVVLSHVVVAVGVRDEVARDKFGALVDELIEGVLAVGAGLAPHDGAGGHCHALARLGDALAVALHVALLEVGGKAVHVLVVRQQRVCFRAKKVVVPHAQEGEGRWDVVLERRSGKVLVHVVRACKKLHEVGHADGQGDGHADAAPQRVAAPHPVPELEHVVGVDAKLRGGLHVCGQRGKVQRNVARIASSSHQPVLSRGGVGDGLLRGECLGGHNEKRGGGRQAAQRLRHVRAVDVGNKVHAKVALGVRLESLGDHKRAKVRPSNADVHNVRDGLARVALPISRPHAVSKGLHLCKGSIHGWHDVLAIHQNGCVAAVAQRDV
mmetsp:Transcript_17218/g.43891  ORF Transcript_17218/g.43891 Transcript_17218/m.43891 type:complete len:430 (-) Transcript_17218:352-1641(-)